MDDGERLEQFVRLRWSRKDGGIRGLADRVGTSADTVYKWFSRQAHPDTEQLARLAEALGVRRFEIVAAMDGEATVLPLNDLTRESFLHLMEEWADQRGLPGPGPEPRTGTDAG